LSTAGYRNNLSIGPSAPNAASLSGIGIFYRGARTAPVVVVLFADILQRRKTPKAFRRVKSVTDLPSWLGAQARVPVLPKIQRVPKVRVLVRPPLISIA
jgi:hypothetical protein